MFLKHHTIDIVLCYCAPHISSIGSIDDRDSTFIAKMSGVFFFFWVSQRISKLTVNDLHIASRRPALKIRVYVVQKKKKQNLPSCGCIPSLSEPVSCSLKPSWRKKNAKEINRTYQDSTSILSSAWVVQTHVVCNYVLLESLLEVWGSLYTTNDGMLVMDMW